MDAETVLLLGNLRTRWFRYGQGVIVMWPEWSAWMWWGVGYRMSAATGSADDLRHRRSIINWLFSNNASHDRPNPQKDSVGKGREGTFALLTIIAVLIFVFVWVAFLYEEPVWTHPTMPEAEQKKAIAVM